MFTAEAAQLPFSISFARLPTSGDHGRAGRRFRRVPLDESSAITAAVRGGALRPFQRGADLPPQICLVPRVPARQRGRTEQPEHPLALAADEAALDEPVGHWLLKAGTDLEEEGLDVLRPGSDVRVCGLKQGIRECSVAGSDNPGVVHSGISLDGLDPALEREFGEHGATQRAVQSVGSGHGPRLVVEHQQHHVLDDQRFAQPGTLGPATGTITVGEFAHRSAVPLRHSPQLRTPRAESVIEESSRDARYPTPAGVVVRASV